MEKILTDYKYKVPTVEPGPGSIPLYTNSPRQTFPRDGQFNSSKEKQPSSHSPTCRAPPPLGERRCGRVNWEVQGGCVVGACYCTTEDLLTRKEKSGKLIILHCQVTDIVRQAAEKWWYWEAKLYLAFPCFSSVYFCLKAVLSEWNKVLIFNMLWNWLSWFIIHILASDLVGGVGMRRPPH